MSNPLTRLFRAKTQETIPLAESPAETDSLTQEVLAIFAGKPAAIQPELDPVPSIRAITVDYTNYRGEQSVRTIEPYFIWFGESEYHRDGVQWFMRAKDLARNAMRDFALKDMHPWPTPTPTS